MVEKIGLGLCAFGACCVLAGVLLLIWNFETSETDFLWLKVGASGFVFGVAGSVMSQVP